MEELNDKLPLATIIALIGAIGALIALITGELTYLEFAAAVGITSGGAGLLGHARNGAGRGLRRR